MGTLVWRWLDDDGKEHKFTTPKSHHSKHGDMRLLSPQHLAKALKDPTGTGETTVGDVCTLFWNGRQNKLTIPLSKTDDVATFRSAPGYNQCEVHCHECKVEKQVTIAPTQVVSDDEDDDSDEEVEVHRHNIDSDKHHQHHQHQQQQLDDESIHPNDPYPDDDNPERSE